MGCVKIVESLCVCKCVRSSKGAGINLIYLLVHSMTKRFKQNIIIINNKNVFKIYIPKKLMLFFLH